MSLRMRFACKLKAVVFDSVKITLMSSAYKTIVLFFLVIIDGRSLT